MQYSSIHNSTSWHDEDKEHSVQLKYASSSVHALYSLSLFKKVFIFFHHQCYPSLWLVWA